VAKRLSRFFVFGNRKSAATQLATGRVRPMADLERQSFHASAIERWMFDVFFISSNHKGVSVKRWQAS
jgi:hypothetical protein